eukprot:jgi/Chlat1/5401/Chrsp35S00402
MTAETARPLVAEGPSAAAVNGEELVGGVVGAKAVAAAELVAVQQAAVAKPISEPLDAPFTPALASSVALANVDLTDGAATKPSIAPAIAPAPASSTSTSSVPSVLHPVGSDNTFLETQATVNGDAGTVTLDCFTGEIGWAFPKTVINTITDTLGLQKMSVALKLSSLPAENKVELRDIMGWEAGPEPGKLTIHSYPMQTILITIKKKQKQERLRQKVDIHIAFADPSDCDKWVATLSDLTKSRPKRIAIVVNPNGGRGDALKKYNSYIKPVFQAAHIELKELFTTHKGHAFDEMKTYDLNSVDGIAVCSGDGVLSEVLNGLMARPDKEEARRMPLASVPVGTGNGVATTVLKMANEPNHPTSGACAVVRGNLTPADIVHIQQGNNVIQSIHSIVWGIGSDIDSLIHMVKFHHYQGRLKYLPGPYVESKQQIVDPEPEDAPEERKIRRLETMSGGDPTRSQAFKSNKGDRKYREGEWIVEEGRFLVVFACKTEWVAHNMHMAPDAHLADGSMELFWIRKAKRVELIKVFMQLFRGAKLKDVAPVHYRKVRAFKLEPGHAGNNPKTGAIAVDGELASISGNRRQCPLQYGPIEATVEQAAVKLFCP